MPTIRERFRKSWNTFLGRDPTEKSSSSASISRVENLGYGTSVRPDRFRPKFRNSRSIVASIQNRIAIDVASVDIEHVRVDADGRFKEKLKSNLSSCLTKEANIDQTGRAFRQDMVVSMFDEGVVAVVPVNADISMDGTQILDVYSLRTGKITAWYPKHVRVDVYNEETGRREEIVLPKSTVAIIENPLYSIMNEPNSTLQRLLRTISKLDVLNEQNASGKLDLIIQLPYVIKSEERRRQAEERRKDIVDQLTGSKYGIAYTDGTEKITQLNRSLDSNLWQQITDLTNRLYNELGLTTSIFDGTADEQTMINYNNRTIEPICAAIAEEFERKFLTKTARTQGQAIKYFRDPFKLVPVSQIADMADKFTRNEIMSSNEFRGKIGLKPSDDPKADELRNSNINRSNEEVVQQANLNSETSEGETTSDGNTPESLEEVQEQIASLGNVEPLSHSGINSSRDGPKRKHKNRRRSK
ncbi:MAG: phage portal protein [Butyrivibrio sp.]|nr:phage portal protein [Butyrivibrio sp.]